MERQTLIETYNRDKFLGPSSHAFPQTWESSPALGKKAPDFPLWSLDLAETTLSALWKSHRYTIVEFGSFT